MPVSDGTPAKPVRALTHGDETLDYGRVEYREGRKVWFERTIVTFPTVDDLVPVTPETALGDDR